MEKEKGRTEQKGERTSFWSALAAVGIGIAGSWC